MKNYIKKDGLYAVLERTLDKGLANRAALLPLIRPYCTEKQLRLLTGENPASLFTMPLVVEIITTTSYAMREEMMVRFLRRLRHHRKTSINPPPKQEGTLGEDLEELDTFGEWHERTRDGVTTWEPRYPHD